MCSGNYVFRQSRDGKILVDRFVLDGMKNELNRKLEVRFKRSGQRFAPLRNSNPQSHGHLHSVDSLDFRDVNGQPFHEPSTELSWLGDIRLGWFSVVLLPTDDHDVHRWHIFYLTAQSNKLEYASLKSSKDEMFDFKDHFVLAPEKGNVPGLIRRSFDICDADGVADLAFTGAPVASQYDVQTEQDTDSGPHLLREATRVLVNIPTASGAVSISFAAAKDGRLSHVGSRESQDGHVDSSEQHLRATRREVILPLDTLDAIKLIGDTQHPPHGTFNTVRRGSKDRIEIVVGDTPANLKAGELIRITNTSSMDGHYDSVSDVTSDQFSVPKPEDMNLSGQWVKIDHDTSGQVSDGMITSVCVDETGVEVASMGTGLKDGDAVQITGTEAINGLHRVASVSGTKVVLERKWHAGNAVNLSRAVGNRRGVRFIEDVNSTAPSYGQTKALDLTDLNDGAKGGYTVSVWAYRSDEAMLNRVIFTQMDGAICLKLVNGFATAFSTGKGERPEVKDPVAMPLNTWVHFAVTIRAGTGGHGSDILVLKLYRDGVEVAFPSIAYTSPAPSWDCQIANQIPHDTLTGMVRLGWYVDVCDDTAVVSAVQGPNGQLGKSYVHVFRRSGAVWNRETVLDIFNETCVTTLTPKSLAVDGDTIAVGIYDDENGTDDAVVLIYRRTGTEWRCSQLIADIGPQHPARRGTRTSFGSAVALCGGHLFIGAKSGVAHAGSSAGKVYALVDNGATFEERDVLLPDAGVPDTTQFGATISATAEHLVVGSGGKDAIYRASFFPTGRRQMDQCPQLQMPGCRRRDH